MTVSKTQIFVRIAYFTLQREIRRDKRLVKLFPAVVNSLNLGITLPLVRGSVEFFTNGNSAIEIFAEASPT
jgi:hypothetical protein